VFPTTRDVLINDNMHSSQKSPKSSQQVFCDEFVTKMISSWNERHRLTIVTKRDFSS
jgi:hypothetical protein